MSYATAYKVYITRRKAEGKIGGHILIIVGRKLLDRIWAIAKTKSVFSPQVPTPLSEPEREELVAIS